MKLKYGIVFAVVCLAGSMPGMDGIEYLKENRWIESAAVTSTGLSFKLKPLAFRVAQNDINAPWRLAQEYVEKDEALVLDPEQWTWFIISHSRVMFTPVSFKSGHKGFRVTSWATGAAASSPKAEPVITYIVLSDTPMALGESDVEMVKDKGEWVKAEDSKSLIIEKLGWYAEGFVKDIDRIMQDPEVIARILENPFLAKQWNTLVAEGLIKTNAVAKQQEEQFAVPVWVLEKYGMIADGFVREADNIMRDPNMRAKILGDPGYAKIWNALVEEGFIKTNTEPQTVTQPDMEQGKASAPPPNRTWLYIVIPLCLLLPILYFLRRKLTNH